MIWAQTRYRSGTDDGTVFDGTVFDGTAFDRTALAGPFLGAEAVSSGLVRKHHLRSRYVALFPGVYLAAGLRPTFADRVEAAWLWSRRQGVVAGPSASRLFGAKWVDDEAPIELVWTNARAPSGIRTSALELRAGETVVLGQLLVTSVTRTAFDLARRPPWRSAVARLDALGAAADFDRSAVVRLAECHKGLRGIRQVPRVLEMSDVGAQSPKETWLRLLISEAGFPRPQTQIPVRGAGGATYYLDMGWAERKIAVEYDGDHHRTNRAQFARDIARLDDLACLGWIVIRVAADTPRREILARLRRAWEASSTLR